MPIGKMEVLKLFRLMLREARKFPAYNFRSYFLRRIKDGFHENRSLTDQSQILTKYEEGVRNLELIKRQVIVSSLYKVDNIVVENKSPKTVLSDIKST